MSSTQWYRINTCIPKGSKWWTARKIRPKQDPDQQGKANHHVQQLHGPQLVLAVFYTCSFPYHTSMVLASPRILGSSLQPRLHLLRLFLEPWCKHPSSTCSHIFHTYKASTMWMMPSCATSPRCSRGLP